MSTKAINFRDTAGYVTDGTDETYCTSADNHPVTRGGITFGWVPIGTITSVNRDSGVDRRLAGINYTQPGFEETFRYDLQDGPGTYRIYYANGDTGGAQGEQRIRIYDDNTLLLDRTHASVAQDTYYDGSDTNRSEANWPSQNTYTEQVFSSSILRLKFGTASTGTGYFALAHLKLEFVSSSVTPAAVDAVAATVNPTVIGGSVLVSPDAAVSVAATVNPTVNVGGNLSQVVQEISEIQGTSTCTPTFGSNVVAGNMIVAILAWNHANAVVSSLTDSLGNTYSLVPGSLVGPLFNSTNFAIYTATDILGGACTVTGVLDKNPSHFCIQVIELSGTRQDVDDADVATGSSSQVTLNLTTTADNAPIIAGAVWTGDGVLTPGSGYTRIDSQNINNRFDSYYDVDVGASGAKTVSFPFDFNPGSWLLGAVAFKAPSGGPSVAFEPAAAAAIAAIVNPTLSLSGMTVAPAAVNTVGATVDPTVGVVGGQVVNPAVADSVAATVDPTVVGGVVSVSPAAADTVSASVNPTVQLGSLTLIPSPVDAVASSTFTFFLGGYVTLEWDASVGATGYRIYYDSNSGVPYTGTGAIRADNGLVDDSSVDVGNVLQFTLRNLVSQQNWYFAVTAYNATGESDYSNELVVFVTTGAFIAPAIIGAVASAVDPTGVILGSLSLSPAVANSRAESIDPGIVTAGGGITVPPQPAGAVSATVNPTVFTHLVLTPTEVSAVAGTIEPALDVGPDLVITPQSADTVAASVNPEVFVPIVVTPAEVDAIAAVVSPVQVVIGGGGIALSPESAAAVSDVVTTPGIGQSSMTVNLANGFAVSVAATANPTVSVAGDLGVTPASAVDAVAATVNPGVILGSITILVDNIPQIANAIAATVDPVGLEGSTLVAPDAADAVAATADPTVPIDLVVAPAAASALAETVDPSVAFGATEFAGDLAEVVASALIGNVAIRNAAGDGVNTTSLRTTLVIGI